MTQKRFLSVKGHKGVLGLETGMKELSARVATCAGHLLYKATTACTKVCGHKNKFPMESTVISTEKSYFCNRNTIRSELFNGYTRLLAVSSQVCGGSG